MLLPPSRIATFSSSSARQSLVFICSVALLPPSVVRLGTIVFVWSSCSKSPTCQLQLFP
ncbi:hypothetical protein AHAS_Ahas19G0152200 [Arachis hypogaea]